MKEKSAFYESEACFRRYENYIIQAIIAYPEEVRFEPQGRAAVTDATRCRDAITAWRKYQWQAALDPVAYKVILADLTAWTSMGFVCLGSRQVLKVMRKELNTTEQKDALKLAMQSMKPKSKMANVVDENFLADIAAEETANFLSLSIERAVELIDEGTHAGPYVCENTPDNLSRAQQAIGERLNVVYVINKEGKIQIF